jgi:hypothetical protein
MLRAAPIGILVGTLAAGSSSAQEAEQHGDVRSGKWMVDDEPAQTATYRGETCLAVSEQALPVLKGLEFENGTIEMDMALTRPDGFIGVDFRVEASGKRFERIYFRPGASETPNAIQHDPHFNGYSNWQVYNPPLHEGEATLPKNGDWFHVKIDVDRSQARVFVGEAEEPQLVVRELISGSSAGAVGLWCAQAGAYFANITIRPADIPESTKREEEEDARKQPLTFAPDVIAQWRVSGPFLIPPDLDEEARRTDEVNRRVESADYAAWTEVQPENEAGLINLNRSILDRPEGNATVLAGVLILSEEDQSTQLLFDSAEGVVVSLNGQSLYAGNDLMNRPEWRVNPGEHSVELQLKKGRNELVLAVSSQRVGWAFLGRLSDSRGLAIEPLMKVE